MIQQDYGIAPNPISTRNPQANAVLERLHRTIRNMIRTFDFNDKTTYDEDHPFSGILSAVATRTTCHTTTQATPSQLVFGRDAILNTKFEADWKIFRNCK